MQQLQQAWNAGERPMRPLEYSREQLCQAFELDTHPPADTDFTLEAFVPCRQPLAFEPLDDNEKKVS